MGRYVGQFDPFDDFNPQPAHNIDLNTVKPGSLRRFKNMVIISWGPYHFFDLLKVSSSLLALAFFSKSSTAIELLHKGAENAHQKSPGRLPVVVR